MSQAPTNSIFYQTFAIWRLTTTLSPQRRTIESFSDTGLTVLGILANASPSERLLYSQPNHDVQFSIVHRGTPVARVGDQLRFNNMHYYITEVLDPGRIGRWTVYFTDMRRADPQDIVDPNI